MPTDEQVFSALGFPIAALLIYYTGFVGAYSTGRSSFRNSITALHSAPGLTLLISGTVLWAVLLLGSHYYGNTTSLFSDTPSVEAVPWFWDEFWFWTLFGLWLVSFYGNTLTGFAMIPQLPNCDPSTKREFMTLVCCQLSFLPAILGMLDSRWTRLMQLLCYGICGIGMLVASANFLLYVLDYAEGKSQDVCSGSYLVSQMEKQRRRQSSWTTDYITVCFRRGSDKTRMPANRLMMFIGLTLLIPFPFIAFIGYRLPVLLASYYGASPARMALPALLQVVMLSTVGNMQVFHGTLSVRGKVSVKSASLWVACTTVGELVLMGIINNHVLGGWPGTQEYLQCIFTGLCRSPIAVLT